jgi:hypothetical protein
MYLFASKRNEVSGEYMSLYNDKLMMCTNHFLGELINERTRQGKRGFEVGNL